jgi:hypothetical protein
MQLPRYFRKKRPEVVTAMRFEDAASASAIMRWAAEEAPHGLNSHVTYHPNGVGLDPGPAVLVVKTPTGNSVARLGDWVLHRVVDGQDDYWPVAPDIFEATYEPTDADA